MNLMGQLYHTDCFTCSSCNKNLIHTQDDHKDQPFKVVSGNPYCNTCVKRSPGLSAQAEAETKKTKRSKPPQLGKKITVKEDVQEEAPGKFVKIVTTTTMDTYRTPEGKLMTTTTIKEERFVQPWKKDKTKKKQDGQTGADDEPKPLPPNERKSTVAVCCNVM